MLKCVRESVRIFRALCYYHERMRGLPRGTEMVNKTADSQTDSLFDAILSLKTREECYVFFDDVCTENEINTMAQRFAVARLLLDGGVYADIVAKTRASTATVSRVKRCLKYGSGGYRLGAERLEKK